jgi:hypothetical protein
MIVIRPPQAAKCGIWMQRIGAANTSAGSSTYSGAAYRISHLTRLTRRATLVA